MSSRLIIVFSLSWLAFSPPSAQATIITIADTFADFSTVAHGTNGFQYGHYGSSNATTGTFSTANMSVSGVMWHGTDNFSTPQIEAKFMYPADNFQKNAVRRYTIEAPGEEDIDTTQTINISGKFWDNSSGGSAAGFVTVDGTNLYDVTITDGSTEGGTLHTFNLNVSVSPGSVIDFGIRNLGNYSDDGSAMFAQITATAVPEPASLAMFVWGGLAMFARRRLNRQR